MRTEATMKNPEPHVWLSRAAVLTFSARAFFVKTINVIYFHFVILYASLTNNYLLSNVHKYVCKYEHCVQLIYNCLISLAFKPRARGWRLEQQVGGVFVFSHPQLCAWDQLVSILGFCATT